MPTNPLQLARHLGCGEHVEALLVEIRKNKQALRLPHLGTPNSRNRDPLLGIQRMRKITDKHTNAGYRTREYLTVLFHLFTPHPDLT